MKQKKFRWKIVSAVTVENMWIGRFEQVAFSKTKAEAQRVRKLWCQENGRNPQLVAVRRADSCDFFGL